MPENLSSIKFEVKAKVQVLSNNSEKRNLYAMREFSINQQDATGDIESAYLRFSEAGKFIYFFEWEPNMSRIQNKFAWKERRT